MARDVIAAGEVDAGSPIDENLMSDKIKNNDDDHETRIVTLEGNGSNWTDQLGTLLTDTDMGAYTGDVITDNTDQSAINQEIADFSETGTNTETFSDSSTEEVNSTPYVDMPDSDFTLKTMDRPFVVHIDYDFDYQRGFSVGTVCVQLVYGGNATGEICKTVNSWSSENITVTALLPPGTHTIKLQGKTTHPGTSGCMTKDRSCTVKYY